MPKGVAKEAYAGEFKLKVIEYMRNEHMSYRETERLFGVSRERIQRWERIYLEEGSEGLFVEHRGMNSKGRLTILDKKVEADLISENQRLRMENDYLKKLNALVQKRENQAKKPK